MTDRQPPPSDDAIIACSLDVEGQMQRGRDFAALCPQSMQRQGAGLVARYRSDDEPAVRGFADAERACCPFLDITVDREDDEVVLRISGPAEAAPVIDAFLSIPG